ncbi:MAG: NAD-dependent DNA ligase LigA [Clostridia bacterium]|nr:NAD-dependent DNA ligase LigA [Clostridia bacterium]
MDDREMKLKEMDELIEELNDHAYRYYVLDAPVISDAEYDVLFDRLLALEEETGVVRRNSPTIRVGGKVLDGFRKHTHIAPLYSLQKSKTFEELKAWEKRLGIPENEPRLYTLEYKFDGLTINLTYEDGKMVMAATRGDGITGEEIFEQAKTIKSIPMDIPFRGRMEVQGEAIMHLSDLEEFNRTAKEPLKNARNACAGALRNLDTKVTASRKLDVYFYNVGYIEGKRFSTHTEMISFLKENRFKVNDFERLYDNLDDVLDGIKEAGEHRDGLDFLIDGMVIKVDDFALRDRLGYTERFPRWAIAYKFPAEEMTTTINEIIWDVGRTGKLTPTAVVDEVDIAGATIRRATLNNIEDIRRKRVNVGTRVFIRRSNDVIPEILGAVPGDENDDAEEPTSCPYCGTKLERIGPNLYCPNTLSCRPQLTERIVHFSSREAMNIEGLSDKTVELMFQNLSIKEISDLYRLTKEDILSLPGFKDKKADKLLEQIEKSKKPELSNFIFALGINNVGKKTARDLAKTYRNFENFRNAKTEDLLKIEDIGEVVAQCITDFFSSEAAERTLKELFELGVQPVGFEEKKGPLEGLKIVVTGTLSSMTRNEAFALIEENGGTTQSSVGKNTDLLIVGENAGSKLEKARTLGVRTVSEQEFMEMIGR